MRFEISSPTKAYIHDASGDELYELRKELTYTNTAASHDVKRHHNNKLLRRKDNDAWQKKLDFLKSKVKNTLVFSDSYGKPFIRPGSVPYLLSTEIENKITYPTPKKVAWKQKLPFELHEYQKLSVEKLIEVKHGNVELCTGAGKSAIILSLCRETGFNAAIVVPSRSIFRELLKAFEKYLGKDKVGGFGDGKRKIGKKFTVCIGDSLCNVKPGTDEWEFFSKLDMMIVDESHTWGAETLEDICHGILGDVPYRFFMSGTQTRGDGAEKLLQSIIGKTVHTLTTAEAIAGGFISNHNFTLIDIESSNPNYNDEDPLVMKRIHFLNNRNIAAFIAKLANAEATANRRQTLVLVEELSQIAMLLPLLKVPTAYAHSETNKIRLESMGMKKVDTDEAVEKFNKAEALVLIGTSCIATGTNIYPTHNVFNWVGGGSEIKTKQGAVGRSVRLHDQNPFKDKCVKKDVSRIFDFHLRDIPVLSHQLTKRLLCYRESGTDVKRIQLDGKTKETGGVR
jgi:superfamily II DNA or RNA helicase